jgi:hypothetical protein
VNECNPEVADKGQVIVRGTRGTGLDHMPRKEDWGFLSWPPIVADFKFYDIVPRGSLPDKAKMSAIRKIRLLTVVFVWM